MAKSNSSASASKIIARRKIQHLDWATSPVGRFQQTTTLLEEVHLIHQAFPEKAISDVETQVEFLKRTFKAPLLISGMTGGPLQTKTINQDLACIAEQLNIPFGLGSMRPLLLSQAALTSYCVKEKAPSVFLLGNIGLVQAKQTPSKTLQSMLRSIGADGLYVHVNPAMELVQPEGDRDFSSGYDTIARLCQELDVPILVKETGCGISRAVGEHLIKLGVAAIDVAGAGGTNFVRIEQKRQKKSPYAWHESLSEWGIPTAASIAMLANLGVPVVGSGGITTALEAAKALALGAQMVGVAGTLLSVYMNSGSKGVSHFLQELITGIRSILLLSGARSIKEISSMPKVIGPNLKAWLSA